MSLRCNSYLQNGSKLKTVLIISLLLNLILLSVCLGLRLWWRNNHDTSVNDGALHGERCYSFGSEVNLSKDSVCVSCDHLGDDVRAEDTLYDVIVSSKCGNRLCCYRDRDIWSLIHTVLEIPDQRSTEGGDLTWWYNRPDAAHLFLDHSLSPPQWSPNNVPGVSFTNLPFKNNRISIQKEGLYFVYAVFSLDFSNFGPGIPQVYHNITSQHPLLTRTGPELHFMNKYGGFTKSGQNYYSSFLSGILHLRRGVEIATQISLHSMIDITKYSNYFGVFKLNK